MTADSNNGRRRPIGVWIIFGFYLLSAGFSLLSTALVFSGVIPVTPSQSAHLSSLSAIDWICSIGIGVVSLSAALSLFLLRRISVGLFTAALALNLTYTAIQILTTNWLEAIGGPGFLGMLIGWTILVFVILYARKLAKRGVLF